MYQVIESGWLIPRFRGYRADGAIKPIAGATLDQHYQQQRYIVYVSIKFPSLIRTFSLLVNFPSLFYGVQGHNHLP